MESECKRINRSEFCVKSCEESTEIHSCSHKKLKLNHNETRPETELDPKSEVVLDIDHENSMNPLIMKHLKEWQIDAVKFGLNRDGKILLADEMGLGKTYSALGIMSCYCKEDWPLLVITPSSMKSSWKLTAWKLYSNVILQNESQIVVLSSSKEFVQILHKVYMKTQRKPDRWNDSNDDATGAVSNEPIQILITSYELLTATLSLSDSTVQSRFGSVFSSVILDESHLLRNTETNRSQTLIPALSNFKRIVLLTGTPAVSYSNELQTQYAILRGGFHHEFDTEIMKRMTLRRIKNDVNCSSDHDLHIEKIRSCILVELDRESRNQIDELITKWMKLKHEVVRQDEYFTIQRVLYQKTGMVKAYAACFRMIELLESSLTVKIVLFANHRVVLDCVENCLNERNIRSIRIDGSVKVSVRSARVDEFQNESTTVRVALLSLNAASVGITLTKADFVIQSELAWTPAQLLQAEDRAFRLGRKDNVYIEYLLAPGTLDDYMWPLIQSKIGNLSDIYNNSDPFQLNFTENPGQISTDKKIQSNARFPERTQLSFTETSSLKTNPMHSLFTNWQLH